MKRTLVIIMSFILAVGLPACGQDAESTSELEQQTGEAGDRDLAPQMEESEAGDSESEQQGDEAETENDESEQQDEETETENDESEQLIEDAEISGKCGDHLIWYYKNEVLYISGTGEMFDYDFRGDTDETDGSVCIYGTTTPWDNLHEKIDEIIIDEGVTSIGKWAFYDCSNLTEITIPEGVTSIGDNAFDDCGKLTEITIPEGVTSIGDWAFSKCSSITEITISDSVTSIGCGAFSGCSSLREITIPDSVTNIVDEDRYSWARNGSINLNIFDSCSDLTVYYSGNDLDEYINSYQVEWNSNHITWIKQ